MVTFWYMTCSNFSAIFVGDRYGALKLLVVILKGDHSNYKTVTTVIASHTENVYNTYYVFPFTNYYT